MWPANAMLSCKSWQTRYIVLNSTDEANGVLAKLHDTVIWSLYNCESVDPSNTVFCFVEWTIYGEKSAFTEKISDILMRTGGPHFIYKSSEWFHIKALT